MLIIAPGNAAAQRILESICNTGFEDACLLVSESYFCEWHQDSYHHLLSTFVHTKEKVDMQKETSFKRGKSVRAEDRAAHDFRERNVVKHVGKYSKLPPEGPKPSVVIATNGCIASSLVKGFNATTVGWHNDVKRLMDWSAIDMVIMDESSQIWEGYALSWLPCLSKLQNLVIVGDEKQLAPHGEDRVDGLRSFLQAASAVVPHIPARLLDETWRLPTCIAEFISETVYSGQVKSKRAEASDSEFLRRCIALQRLIPAGVLASLLRRRTTAVNGVFDKFGPLAWVQLEGKVYKHEGRSSGNFEEAKQIASWAADLLKACYAEAAVSKLAPMRVAILTGYLEVLLLYILRIFVFTNLFCHVAIFSAKEAYRANARGRVGET